MTHQTITRAARNLIESVIGITLLLVFADQLGLL